MLKNWMHDITLAIQAKSGLKLALLVWLAVIAAASLTAFAFLCIAFYAWLSLQFGVIYGGLIEAGVFVLIALIAALVLKISRRRTRQRAMLERAARAQNASWLFDPKILGAAIQAGRRFGFGFERLIPIALLGLLAAQWARESRQRKSDEQS